MALIGAAALAMWWDIAPAVRADFEHWHAHEHFPERLSIPGFRRASRWHAADGGEGVFVLYELDDHAVLSSPAYAARLNQPSAWSTRLMPAHRHMVRSQCRVLASGGAVVARCIETVRLSPLPGRDAELQAAVAQLSNAMPGRAGLVGLHLLGHETPTLAATAEQRLRGLADASADRVLLIAAYDEAALAALCERELGDAALQSMGAAEGTVRQRLRLAMSALPGDVAGVAPTA